MLTSLCVLLWCVSGVCVRCGLGVSKAPLLHCLRCDSAVHFDCLTAARPPRKPQSGVIDLCDGCMEEELARQSRPAADGSLLPRLPSLPAAAANGQHRGEEKEGQTRAKAVLADDEEEEEEEEEDDEAEGDDDDVRVLRPPLLPSPRRPSRPLTVTDPSSIASSAVPQSPVYSSASTTSDASFPSLPPPMPRRLSLKGSAARAPPTAQASPSSTPRPPVPLHREKRPKVTASAAVSAAAVPSSTASSPTSSTPSTPPSLPAKLSERLAGVVGGDVGVRFAAEVEAVVQERRLTGKELRDLYTRIVPNLSNNAALLSSVRLGRLSAAELCSMSNHQLADEKVQREREEAAKQSLKDVIAAPEVMIAKVSHKGEVEYVHVAGQKVTQADPFDERIAGPGTRRGRGGGAGDPETAVEEETDPWDDAGELPSNRRQRRDSVLDSPLSPSSDEGDPFRGGGEGWDGVTAEEMEKKYDDDHIEAGEGDGEVEEVSADAAAPFNRPAAARRRPRGEEEGKEGEVDVEGDDEVELITRENVDGDARKKRRRVDADGAVDVEMEGPVESDPPPSSSSAAPHSADPSRLPPSSVVDAQKEAAVASSRPSSSPLPTIDLFDSGAASVEPPLVPAKSPKSPRVKAAAAPESRAVTPPLAGLTSAAAQSPASPPLSPSSVSVIPSFQPLSASRSAAFFSGPLHSRVTWKATLQFEHHGALIPFSGRLVGVSGQSESQEAVRALSSSALPSRVSVTARESVAAAEELLREIGHSDLRMAALFVLTPAPDSLKAMEAFCAFHAEKQRVGICDARGPDKVGLFFRFGRLAPLVATKGQRSEVHSETLRLAFSGVGGIREERAFFAVVAWLDRRRPQTGDATHAAVSRQAKDPPVTDPAAPSAAVAAPLPPSTFPPAPHPFAYAPSPYGALPAPLPPSGAAAGPPAAFLPPADPRARPPDMPVGFYPVPVPVPHPLYYSQYPALPGPPAGYGGPPPSAATAPPSVPSQASNGAAFDPAVLGFLSSIQQPPPARPSGLTPASQYYGRSSPPSPPLAPRSERPPPGRSPPRDPRAPPVRPTADWQRSARDSGREGPYTESRERGGREDSERGRGTREVALDLYPSASSAYSSSREREKERDRLLEAQQRRRPSAAPVTGPSSFAAGRRPPAAMDRETDRDAFNRERERQRQEERERERERSFGRLPAASPLSSPAAAPSSASAGAGARTSGYIHPSRLPPQRR